jgi:hypothetical protein
MEETVMKTFFLCLMFVPVFCLNILVAQINETKLLPEQAQEGDYIGISVACDADYLVFGALYSDGQFGSAYVYENIAGVWTEKGKLLAGDGEFRAEFGWSVSVYGDFILIGAWRDDQNGVDAGAAYVFERDSLSGDWIQQAKLVASDAQAYDRFGSSVALWDDYALIGAIGENMEAGSAYLFRRYDSIWTEEAKLEASNGVGQALFGCSASMVDNYAVIGALNDQEMGEESGAVYVFYFDGVNWTQQAKLHSANISPYDYFGYSVSISGDYLLVGAPNKDTAGGGAAYVFHRNGAIWTQQVEIEGSITAITAFFGGSVSIDGEYAVIGAPQDNTNGNLAGCAYIFRRDGTNWVELATLLASDGDESDQMGWSVYVENDQVFTGAIFQDTDGLTTGAVYVYDGFTTGISQPDKSRVPLVFSLGQNYPNPFNPSTTIAFDLPGTVGNKQHASLVIYDIRGRRVRTLIDSDLEPGGHKIHWDGRDDRGHSIASGIYLYSLRAGDGKVTRKMTVLK